MSSATTGVNAPLLENKPPGKHTSVSGAVFNVSTSIIGAGIMSIPATLKVLGVIPAFVLIVVIAWLADVSVEFMLRHTHAGNSTTYAGVMKESFGRVGSILVQICVMTNNLGCLIIYLIIIGKFSLALNHVFEGREWINCSWSASLASLFFSRGCFFRKSIRRIMALGCFTRMVWNSLVELPSFCNPLHGCFHYASTGFV